MTKSRKFIERARISFPNAAALSLTQKRDIAKWLRRCAGELCSPISDGYAQRFVARFSA